MLNYDLAQDIDRQQKLQAEGVPASGYSVVVPASPDRVTVVPGGPSFFDHWYDRALAGVVLGTLVGVLITYLMEAFDQRLRTARRMSEAFGLPVIVQVPGDPPALVRGREAAVPVVDVVVDPLSPASEAYRRLHVAAQVAPLVLWVRHGEVWPGPGTARRDEPVPATELAGAGRRAPAGADPFPPPPGTFPVPTVAGTPIDGQRRRVVLVTSPTDEPTRSLTVANLAAVLAEAGQRVLVATTGGLRTNLLVEGRPTLSFHRLGPDPSPEEIVAHARPSQLPGVSSLALGQLVDTPSKLALRAPAVIEAAKSVVDVVLLEAPLVATQDGAALLPVADVVVVVGETWRTTVGEAEACRDLLYRHRPSVLGVAMTNVPLRRRWPWSPRDDDRRPPVAGPPTGGGLPPGAGRRVTPVSTSVPAPPAAWSQGPDPDEPTSVPHADEPTAVPHTGESTAVPHTGESTAVPHTGESTAVPHTGESTAVPRGMGPTAPPPPPPAPSGWHSGGPLSLLGRPAADPPADAGPTPPPLPDEPTTRVVPRGRIGVVEADQPTTWLVRGIGAEVGSGDEPTAVDIR